MSPRWTAIDHARLRVMPRVAFHVAGAPVGSVARAHLDALRDWPRHLRIEAEAVHLDVPPDMREPVLAEINAVLREQGLIRAWRDEAFALYDAVGSQVLARFERAAARFWGTLTLGAHANGYVAAPDGRPAQLWIATRALDKATDPGLRDNLVGGGVPLGQTPFETLVREGWEEAGLEPAEMLGARPGRVIRIDRDAPEGRMVEHVHVFDVALPGGRVPRNQDGEVAAIECLDVAAAADLAASGCMTVDAALVTLDFLLRHRLLPLREHEDLDHRMAALWAAGS
jgi:8-oxo-dGTP pyrophosphatase MutT (NUDIX family)